MRPISDLLPASDSETDILVTSKEAEERGYHFSKPAPDPVTCEFCGRTLYYQSLVRGSRADGRKEIYIWEHEPERCDCPEAVKHWEEYDAEQERKRKEEEAERERLRHEAAVEQLLSKSGICKRFRQRTFENFRQDTKERKKAYEVAHNYAVNFDEALKTGEGLYIEGTFGTGKTHLAAAIAMYLMEKEYSVVIKTSFDLFEEIKRTFDESNGKTEYQVMEDYKKCDLLIIDDLGKEQCTDWSMSVLYSIVNYRYEAMRPVIITTNFSGDDLIQTLTPKGYGSQKIRAIMSRLWEVSRPLTMAWTDYRRG